MDPNIQTVNLVLFVGLFLTYRLTGIGTSRGEFSSDCRPVVVFQGRFCEVQLTRRPIRARLIGTGGAPRSPKDPEDPTQWEGSWLDTNLADCLHPLVRAHPDTGAEAL